MSPTRSIPTLRGKVAAQIGADASVAIVAYRVGPTPDPTGERYVVTAAGAARPGLVHTVSAIVAARGGNFTDFYSQAAGDRVTMVAEVDLPADVALDQLQIDLSMRRRTPVCACGCSTTACSSRPTRSRSAAWVRHLM